MFVGLMPNVLAALYSKLVIDVDDVDVVYVDCAIKSSYDGLYGTNFCDTANAALIRWITETKRYICK